MTQTIAWVQDDGLNEREGWEINWNERAIQQQKPVAARFEPINGLHPIYCSCYGEMYGYAILKVPPAGDGEPRLTDWFPLVDWNWIVAPEKFVYPQ